MIAQPFLIASIGLFIGAILYWIMAWEQRERRASHLILGWTGFFLAVCLIWSLVEWV